MENKKPATKEVATVTNPFMRSLDSDVSKGAVEIESSRAVAEAQGKLVIAKKFPRDQAQAFERTIESCKRLSLAESALYSFPRGGSTISGPSIRFAEELARNWGNIDFGMRELSQKEGESEVEVYCWDLETNAISSFKFSVKHELHTRNGVKKLTDPRDIYEMVANQASRRLRARILSVLPPDLIQKALEQIEMTLRGDKPTVKGRIDIMVKKFKDLNVEGKAITKYLGKPLKNIDETDLSNLVGIYNTINDGIKPASDYFEVSDETAKAVKKIETDVKKGPEPAPSPEPAPAPEPAPKPEPAASPAPAPEAAKPAPEQPQPEASAASVEQPAPEVSSASPEAGQDVKVDQDDPDGLLG